MSDLLFREHTWDRNIWISVAQNNEYALPERFDAEDVVLDIGAHIGAFAYAVLDRGAGRVLCVEPDPENFLYLRHNLHYACKATDRAVCVSAACWRGDGFHPLAHYGAVGANTGGGNTLGEEGMPVASFSLAALARLASEFSEDRLIRLVKLDCEGAEWPILYTSHPAIFTRIDAFLGEYHTLAPEQFPSLHLSRPCDAEGLRLFFEELGYHFHSMPTGNGLGIFRAWRVGKEI